MGVVYHGHYLDYLEYARTEALRNAGLPYKQLEDSGIVMPVVDLAIRFHYPAKYDVVLEIRTVVGDEIPRSKIVFDYEVRVVESDRTNSSDEPPLAASATVSLCFVDARSGRPRRAPEMVVDVFRSMLEGR